MSPSQFSRSGRGAIAKAISRRRGDLQFEKPDGFLWLALILLMAVVLMSSPARATESPTQLEMPKPWVFINPDSISFAVIHARPEDLGVRALLDYAWSGLKDSKSPATKGLMGLLLRVIQGDNTNALVSFLPLQMVRVDSLDPETAQPHPTLAVTVSGWGGLQTPFYAMMSRDEDGNAYPTKDLEDATLVLREGWKDPTRSHVLTRVKGTWVSFPTVEKAEVAIKKLASKEGAPPKGELGELLTTLDSGRDTYGVLLNRKGSLMKFLSWLNKGEVARATAVVGQERMDKVMSKVTSMTWEGDLLSDNEMNFYIRFRTESPEARKELATLMKDVREVLNSLGRAGEMKTTGIGSELQVDFTMVGYRDMVSNYINSNGG